MISIDATPLHSTYKPAFPVIGCFVLLVTGLYLATGPIARFSNWRVDPSTNPGMAEALAWHEGRLDLTHRMHDSALFDGRVYNAFPPLFTLVAWATTGLASILGGPRGHFPASWYVIIVALPIPVVGYWAFLRTTEKPAWAALFVAGWILGTPILPALAAAREGGINHINHLLSQTGLMLIALGLLGKRQFGLGLIGLLIATWSRPLCIFFAIPLFWMAKQQSTKRRRIQMAELSFAIVVALVLPMGLSWAKFGSPLDSGYKYLYVGRDDDLAREGRERLFSTKFVPRNAWYMNLELPLCESGAYGLRPDVNPYGASIWLTMPVLLFILVDARRWWCHPRERWMIIASLCVVAGLLCFHNTGYIQPGYYRFALDFIPIWLIVIARQFRRDEWRTGLTIGAFAWSAVYFNLVTQLYA